MEGAVFLSLQKGLETGRSLDFVKKIIFPSEDTNVWKSYPMQFSEQAHNLLAPTDEKELLVFYKVMKKSDFKIFFYESKFYSHIFFITD